MARHYQGNATTATTEEEFVPELWGKGVYKYFERYSLFRGLVDDYSAFIKGKGMGDTIHIPEMSLVAATAKAADADVSFDSTHSTETNLAIDKHYYVGKLFEDILEIQASEPLAEKYMRMFGESLARQFDADVWAQLILIDTSAVLAADDAMTSAEFQAALASLGENDVPYMNGECSFVVNPTLLADIIDPNAGISKNFWRADASGNGAVLENGGNNRGFVGKLFGINVYMSNAVSTGGTNVSGAIFHPSACAVAVQQEVRTQSQYSIDALGTKVVSDQIYGAKLIDASDNVKGYKFINAS